MGCDRDGCIRGLRFLIRGQELLGRAGLIGQLGESRVGCVYKCAAEARYLGAGLPEVALTR